MSDVKRFDVRHLNNEYQSDLNVNLFDRHSNVKCQNGMNVECQTVSCLTFEMTNVKMI